MRWFKHVSASRDDEKIAKLISEHGMEAYGRWWAVLEAIARGMDRDSDKCSVTYPIHKWAEILATRGSNVERQLRELPATIVRDGRDITATIPNLLKYRDDYSKKSVHTPYSVRTKSQSQKQRQRESPTVLPGFETPDEPPAAAPTPAPLSAEITAAANGLRMDRRTVSKPNSQPTNQKDLDALLTEALACEDKLNCKLLDQEPPDKTALKLAVAAEENGLTVPEACVKIREARDKARGRPDLKPQGAGWLFGVVRGQAFG